MVMPEDLKVWGEENPEVHEWLSSVGDKTRPIYARRFRNFYEWLTAKPEFKDMTPVQLLDHQDKATGRDRARVANLLSIYLSDLANEFRPRTLTSYYSAARSFFAFHGCDLPKRRFSLPEDYKRQSPQNLDREKLVKILQAAKLRDKAMYMFCAMGGLGWREFNIINHENGAEVQQQLDEGRDRIILYVPPRKKNRIGGQSYPVVIGRDAVKLLRQYLKKQGPIEAGEPIFARYHGGPGGSDDEAIKGRNYRKNFEILARRVQLINGKGSDRTSRYGISTHQLRDVFRSEWQRSGADPAVGELLMGHVVDPNAYLKFTEDYILQQYEKAEPRLSYVSAPDLEVVSVDEVEKLRRELEEARRGQGDKVQALEADMVNMRNLLLGVLNNPEALEETRRRLAKET